MRKSRKQRNFEDLSLVEQLALLERLEAVVDALSRQDGQGETTTVPQVQPPKPKKKRRATKPAPTLPPIDTDALITDLDAWLSAGGTHA